MIKRNSKGQFLKGHLDYVPTESRLRQAETFSKRWKGRIFCSKNLFKSGKDNPMSGRNGILNPNWKGGKILMKGYWFIRKPNHPRVSKHNYIKRCWLVAEKYLKRHLYKGETIHHINETKTDDRPENLYLFPNNREHTLFHKLKDKPVLTSNLI